MRTGKWNFTPLMLGFKLRFGYRLQCFIPCPLVCNSAFQTKVEDAYLTQKFWTTDVKEVSFESLLNLGLFRQSVQSTRLREVPSLILATYFNRDHSLPTDFQLRMHITSTGPKTSYE